MVSQSIEVQLRDELSKLSLHKQQRVPEFARRLSSGLPPGTPGKDLLRFAGTISAQDAKQMRHAIEEGCERIDPNGW